MIGNSAQETVEKLARQQATKDKHYGTCFADVSFEHSDGVLTLGGKVKSFYLKQVLQTLLRSVSGIQRIDNLTDVVDEPEETQRMTEPNQSSSDCPSNPNVASIEIPPDARARGEMLFRLSPYSYQTNRSGTEFS